MISKKLVCVVTAFVLAASLSACGGTKNASENSEQTSAAVQTTAVQPTSAQQSTSAAETESTEGATQSASSDNQAAADVEPGKLRQLSDGETPVITGLSLSGNAAGSDELNGRETGSDNIRSVFELNEWIEITPETTEAEGLSVLVLEHKDPSEYTESYVQSVSNAVPFVILQKPEESGDSWGSLYVNSESWKSGYFDLVITKSLKPVACVTIRLYDEGELQGKTDAELNALMK